MEYEDILECVEKAADKSISQSQIEKIADAVSETVDKHINEMLKDAKKLIGDLLLGLNGGNE